MGVWEGVGSFQERVDAGGVRVCEKPELWPLCRSQEPWPSDID